MPMEPGDLPVCSAPARPRKRDPRSNPEAPASTYHTSSIVHTARHPGSDLVNKRRSVVSHPCDREEGRLRKRVTGGGCRGEGTPNSAQRLPSRRCCSSRTVSGRRTGLATRDRCGGISLGG